MSVWKSKGGKIRQDLLSKVNELCPVNGGGSFLQGQSASRELLMNLTCQGWSIADLAKTAKKAGMHSVVDIITAYCEDEGVSWMTSAV